MWSECCRRQSVEFGWQGSILMYTVLILKPNTHRRRRRDETVLSRRVGGVYMNSRRLPTDSNAQHSRRRPVYNSAASGSWLPTGVFTPTTRRNCRQLVANSCTHRRRDVTRQFRLCVGGVYWALCHVQRQQKTTLSGGLCVKCLYIYTAASK